MNAKTSIGYTEAGVTVTPAMAEDWLKTMVSNRKRSDGKVIKYAMIMEKGDWVLNGEPLIFNAEGRLINGYHRLTACTLSGRAFVTDVRHGIEDARAFATIDVGKMRTHGDIFSLAGFTSANESAAVAAVLYHYRHKSITIKGIRAAPSSGKKYAKALGMKSGFNDSHLDKEVLLEFATPYRDRIAEATRLMQRLNFKKMTTTATLAAMYIIFSEKGMSDAMKFMEDLAKGAELSQTDPVFRLRERLLSNLSSPAKLNKWYIIGIMIKAWNKRRSGDKSRTLLIRDDEDFPVAK